jgi:hypothetical protein
LEIKWIKDTTPYVNNGYPILETMKYRGVFTNNAANINTKTALLQGRFVLENEKIIRKGFEYRTENSPKFTVVFVDSDAFSYNLTNLMPKTMYEYRAFVETDKEKIYGQNIEFYTLPEKCSHDCKHDHEHHY